MPESSLIREAQQGLKLLHRYQDMLEMQDVMSKSLGRKVRVKTKDFTPKPLAKAVTGQFAKSPTESYWQARASLGASQLTKSIAPEPQTHLPASTTEAYWQARAAQIGAK